MKLKSEHQMRGTLRNYLISKGYDVLFENELGGGDFFDCVAVGETVGAIELKLSGVKQVAEQARTRLHYVHWTAVLMPSRKSLETIIKKYSIGKQGEAVGLWLFTETGIEEIREAQLFGPRQESEHTINMLRRIVRCKKLKIPNKVAWGHPRGISLMGLQGEFKTMYGRPKEKYKMDPLDLFLKNFTRKSPSFKYIGNILELDGRQSDILEYISES